MSESGLSGRWPAGVGCLSAGGPSRELFVNAGWPRPRFQPSELGERSNINVFAKEHVMARDDHKISEKLRNQGCRCHCATCKGDGHCHNIAAGCAVRR
ncbi:uncharacterized protein PO1_contig-018-62 [Mycobacterium sp. PO1]|nr:uncharacterized protein PO1_contig-018-62 [Mycobacterium sp. PO1]GFM21837.1 uncharacterized protein PO2_contig-002-120 [Mycobacterium sp. PO2]